MYLFCVAKLFSPPYYANHVRNIGYNRLIPQERRMAMLMAGFFFLSLITNITVCYVIALQLLKLELQALHVARECMSYGSKSSGMLLL